MESPRDINLNNKAILKMDFLSWLSAELTLGFEREVYEFDEPTSTSSQATEMICILVRDGNVGTALIVSPTWVPNTATGMKCVAITKWKWSSNAPISYNVQWGWTT